MRGARGDAAAIVGDGDGASFLERGHLGELLALLADGDGADRVHAYHRHLARSSPEKLGDER